jgi:hypothetical protein
MRHSEHVHGKIFTGRPYSTVPGWRLHAIESTVGEHVNDVEFSLTRWCMDLTQMRGESESRFKWRWRNGA